MNGSFAAPSSLASVLAVGNTAANQGITNLASLGFQDTNNAGTFNVTHTHTSTTQISAARTVTWDVNNTSHTLKFTAASTITFPAGTNTLLGSAVANTITTNGALSAPVLSLNGTWISGGSTTTTKPACLIEPTGTASAGWKTDGTALGINASAASTTNFIACSVAGVNQFFVGADGTCCVKGQFVVDDSMTNGAPGASRSFYLSSGGGGVQYMADSVRIIWGLGATLDTGISKTSAGLVEVNSGTAGTLRDLKARDLYTVDATYFLRTLATLTDGAAAQAGTLLNSPAAGNPTKWIAIDDNGTKRHVPAW